jgi:hypothetical protein
MNDFSYATDMNIKRFQTLLETSVDEIERRTIQALLTEELAKVAPPMTLPSQHVRLA